MVDWDAGSEPDRGSRLLAVPQLSGVFQLADCVVCALQPVTRLSESQRETQGQQGCSVGVDDFELHEIVRQVPAPLL